MSPTLGVLIAYLVVLAALAIWSRRETHSLKGYFLAGKKLPLLGRGVQRKRNG